MTGYKTETFKKDKIKLFQHFLQYLILFRLETIILADISSEFGFIFISFKFEVCVGGVAHKLPPV